MKGRAQNLEEPKGQCVAGRFYKSANAHTRISLREFDYKVPRDD